MQGEKITEFELRVILSDYAGIPLKYCRKILTEYDKKNILPDIELEFYNDTYRNFYNTFYEIKNKNIKLSSKIYEMYSRVVNNIPETKLTNLISL